jgi:small subunit ribosomal protein S8
MKDTLSDSLTRLRNSSRVKRPTVLLPSTHATKSITKLLKREGYIDEVLEIPAIVQGRGHSPARDLGGSFPVGLDTKNPPNHRHYRPAQLQIRLKYEGKKMRPSFSHIQRISTPGVRKYAQSNTIPQVLGGLGLIVLSTSQGVMTDTEARTLNIGGELLFSIW